MYAYCVHILDSHFVSSLGCLGLENNKTWLVIIPSWEQVYPVQRDFGQSETPHLTPAPESLALLPPYLRITW